MMAGILQKYKDIKVLLKLMHTELYFRHVGMLRAKEIKCYIYVCIS